MVRSAILVTLEADEELTAAAAEAGRADIVVRDPAVTDVSPDAVERLTTAAEADSTAATVSALRLPSVVPPPASIMRPVIDAPSPGLVLIPRATLDLVGSGSLEQIGTAAGALGLVHLLAGDVTAAPAAAAPTVPAPSHALERTLAAAAIRNRRLTVTIDGRAIGPYRAGTQVHALELIAALARTDAVDLRVIVAHDIAPDAQAAFDAHPRITTVTYDEAARDGLEPSDIVHRPSQFFTQHDLALLHPLGRRVVITHQDLISYRSRGTTASELWHTVRIAAKVTLGAADRVVFFTRTARDDALRDDLVTPDRASVVPIGVDHHVLAAPEPTAPDGFDADPPYLLTLGADLPHKNLPFARRLADALGGHRVVAAGPGSELGQVTEAEKAFLLAHAAAVVYPTLYEGFGLIPFEAARAGVPCLFAPVSALAEILPRDLATLVPWDPEASATATRDLLVPGPARDAHVAGLRTAAAGFTWDAAAAALVDVYRRTVESPHLEREVDPIDLHEAGVALERLGHRFGVLEGDFLAFQEQIGEDGRRLVGANGFLDGEDQRALLAVVARPALRKPLMSAIRAGYRAGRRGA